MALTSPQLVKPVFGESTIQDFRNALQGQLILPEDLEYDEVRKVHNGMVDRRPALIARPVNTQDVVEAVKFGRSHGLLVSVRGGGHSAPGHGVCQNGLMIDLSLMKQVDIDAERRIATAQPGLRLGEYITETEKYGFVTPVGTASDTGLAGLSLGGGYGWLSGKYGMTVDNIVGAEVVLADGRVVRASADKHPDLFWALRGGSGNFGIVTSFEFRLYPLTQVLGGMLVYPFPMAGEVLRYYRDLANTAPDELTTYVGIVTGPDGQQVVGVIPCYCGPVEEGERVIAPIRAFGPPVADMVSLMPYSAMNMLIDAANPPGLQNYWKWNGLKALPDEAIDTIVDFAGRVPSPRSVILIDQLHGAASRVSPTGTAFAHRDAPHGLMMLSMWEDPGDDEANITWARQFAKAMEPFCTGGVYADAVAGNQPRAAYGVNFDRLSKIKARYDPTNFFRHNQNIAPVEQAR